MAEEYRCPLCGNQTYSIDRTLRDRVAGTTDASFTIVRCRQCSLLRLHPQPPVDVLEAAYPDDYAPFNHPGLSGRVKRILERKGVRDIWSYLQPPRAILDIGCASGDLLDLIRRAGNEDVHGIEPDSYAANLARERGIEVTEGYLETAGYPSKRFSTILLDHVLEHVDDPDIFMAEVRRVMIGGGAVVIWVPNVESYAARILRNYWIGYDAPRHLTTFGTSTLAQLLGKHGFRVVRVHHENSGMEWAWGIRLWLRERLPAAEPFLRRFHVLTIIAATPIGWFSARKKKSGRLRVIAVKRPDPKTANPVIDYPTEIE